MKKQTFNLIQLSKYVHGELTSLLFDSLLTGTKCINFEVFESYPQN